MRIAVFALLTILTGHLAAQQPGAANRPIPVGSKYGEPCTKNFKPLQDPRPRYPAAARTAGTGGWAIVRYDIDHGKTHNVAVAESSAAIFDEPAAAAVRTMAFAPDVSLTQCAATFHFDTE